MALTNQPYIPLYVRDWLTSNKLKVCSLPAHGLMINIMCIMHKEDEYGTLSLKQNFKRDEDSRFNFASYLARLLPFTQEEILPSLQELLDEKILYMDEDCLYCNRMIDDATRSKTNANNGGKGGKKTQKKNKELAKAIAKANVQANAEYENEYANANANENETTSP